MVRTPRLGALGLAIVLALAGASDAQGRGRPDLHAAAVSGGPQRLAAGDELMVRDRVVNEGRAPSSRSGLSIYLIPQKFGGPRVALERRSLPTLGPRRSARHAGRIRLPGGLQPGSYAIEACVDAARRGGRSCALSRRAISVATASAGSQRGGGSGTGGGTGTGGATGSAGSGSGGGEPTPADAPAPTGTPAPAEINLDTPADRSYVSTATPTLAGIAPGAGLVTIRIYSGGAASGSPVESLTALPAADGVWSETATPALGSDGTYTAVAERTDDFGLTTKSAPHSFTVDTHDPAVALTLTPAAPNGSGGWYVTMPAVRVTASDTNLTTTACTVDGNAVAIGTGGDVPVSGDGSHTVACAASDRAGRVGVASKAFQVDATAPAPSTTSPAAGAVLSTGTPAIAGSTDDSGAITVSVYSGSSLVRTLSATPVGSSWQATPATALPDGTYSAQVDQVDAAGNTGHAAPRSFTVDTSAPAVSVNLSPASPDGSGGWYVTMPTVHVTATDANLTTTACTVDGSAVTIGTGGSVPVSGDGSRTVSCQASDAAGHTTTRTATFKVDRSAPAVAISSPSANLVTADATPTIAGSAGTGTDDLSTVTVKVHSGSGVGGTVVQTLSPTASAGAWSTTASALADGTYTLEATQQDAAGNIGSATARTFAVDTHAPSLSLTLTPSTPDGSNGIYLSDPTVHPTASDANLASTDCKVDGTAVALDGNGDVPVSGGGSHTVSCTATDAAGNSTTRSTTFSVDSTAPVVAISAPTQGATTTDQTPTFSGTAGTASGDSTAVTVKVYSGTDVSGSSLQTLSTTRNAAGGWSTAATSALPVGSYTLVASQSDSAGNTGSASRGFSSPAVMLAAGDIASCTQTGDSATAALLAFNPADKIAALGDNAYESGTAAEYNNCFDPTWGAFKSKIAPAPGNHEYYGTTDASGYFGYFGAAAGTPGQGWYSYDLGGWHVVVLNSNDACTYVSCAAGSAQEQWLKADLQAHSNQCTLAYFHHPLFTSDALEAAGPTAGVKPLWDDLYAAGADVVLNGHAHMYERFAPQTPDGTRDDAHGIREFVAGTGGYTEHPETPTPATNSQALNNDTHGVLRLVLEPGGYSWQFLPVSGGTFTDSGSDSCH